MVIRSLSTWALLLGTLAFSACDTVPPQAAATSAPLPSVGPSTTPVATQPPSDQATARTAVSTVAVAGPTRAAPTRSPGLTSLPTVGPSRIPTRVSATSSPGRAIITITNLTPSPGSTVRGEPETIIAANLSSPRAIGPITVLLDGYRVDVEVMGPDVNRLSFFTGRILMSGTHTVRVIATGDGGAHAEAEWLFTVVQAATSTPTRTR